MTGRLYTYAAVALVAAALASGGTWRLQEWRHGAKEADRLHAEKTAQEARDTDARQQRQFSDLAAGKHAAALATINRQLGDARAHIVTLSTDRHCFDGGTAGVLNAIGKPASGLGLRAAAGDPAGAAGAAAGPGGDAGAGVVSQRAAGAQIAACRALHAELASQVNQILDIEDRRDAARAAQ